MADTPAPVMEAEPPTTASDADLERQVAERRSRREAAEAAKDDREPRTGRELLKAAVAANENKDELTGEEAVGALDYFLETAEEADVEIEPKTLKINLGNNSEKRWVRWTIAPVEDTLITKIRKGSQTGTRAQRRRGDAEVDEMLVSRKLVVEGTVDPDPRDLAKTMGLVDPADAIQAYFRKYGKTGLITQISGEILSISGWDDEDVQEVEAARG